MYANRKYRKHIPQEREMLKRESINDIEIITLEERIDQKGAEELESAVQECLDSGNDNICIDMINVKHICSSALGVLVSKKRKLRDLKDKKDREGDIKLVIVSDSILKLFQTTMLDKVFEIFDTRRECLTAFD